MAAVCMLGLVAPACDDAGDRAGPGSGGQGAPPQPDANHDGGVGSGGTDGSSGPDGAGGPGEDYAIVVLPDTQFYSSSWPDIFTAQTRWIVENRQALQIAFVLHTGDIVDTDVPEQWSAASRSLHILDGEIPYVITAGNHDYFNLADRMGLINTYFPPSHFATAPWFGGTFEAGHMENNFSIFVAGSQKWLVLALEFGPRDEVLTWADNVVKLFRDTPAIIVTHAYLYRDGMRYDAAGASAPQQFNPHDYVMMGQPGSSVNDGEEIWRKLISINPNVKWVFSGHDVSGKGLPPGTASRLSSTRDDGSVVHQVLANYQTCTGAPCESYAGGLVHGGNGFLRLLKFAPAQGTVSVSTYSPYLDEWLRDPANEFVLPMN